MKYLSLFIILIMINQAIGQSDYFTFGQFINQKEGNVRLPFAIKNSIKNSSFLSAHGIDLKHKTKNYLFCNGDADFFYQAQLKGDLEQVYFEVSQPEILTDSALYLHKGNLVHSGLGGLDTSYTGKGVIVGIVDQGIDYNHPDFQNSDGSTRVLRYWDHTVNDENHPNYYTLYDKGIVWDNTSINNGTCTSLEVGTAHGSTVSGMAVSNASANGTNKGFAPEANIIVVESDFNQEVNNWKLSIADACDYIFKVADSLGMPAVINLSLGSYYGTHDATDPAAELINSLLDEKSGRIVVCAAGNSGQQGPYHVGQEVTDDTTFVWSKPNPNSTIVNNASNVVIYDFVVDTLQDNFNFSISARHEASNYHESGATPFIPFGSSFTSGVPQYENIINSNGDLIAVAFVYREYLAGNIIGQIAISGPNFTPIDSTGYVYGFKTFGSGHYDLWGGSFSGRSDFVSDLTDASQVPGIIFYNAPDTLQTIVDSWNCSDKVISVGNLRNRMSYIDLNGNIFNASPGIAVGEIVPGSSKGPTRTGMQKPDISASGDLSLSSGSFSWLNNPANASIIDQGGFHLRNGGTSMASPVVAGIAALYLQKCNGASYLDFKNDLIQNADIDQYTGNTPNYAYGYGKANALQTLLAKNENVLITAPDGICPGEVATISYTSEVTPSAISWSNGSTNSVIVTTSPGNYQVTLEGALGCKYRSDVNTVFSFTNPIVDAGNDYLLCPNSLFTLSATGTAENYIWNNNITQGEVFTVSAGEYIVEGINSSGCSAIDTLYIELLSTPLVSYNELITEIGVNQNAFNVSVGSPENGVYSGPGIIGTSFHPALAGVGLHVVTYTIIDGNGCAVSDSSVINVYDDLSTTNLANFDFSMSPNPALDEVIINTNLPSVFEVQDIKGRVVLAEKVNETTKLNLNKLAPGVYFVKGRTLESNKWNSKRLIKIK
jgi:subtilisin family serine protease